MESFKNAGEGKLFLYTKYEKAKGLFTIIMVSYCKYLDFIIIL